VDRGGADVAQALLLRVPTLSLLITSRQRLLLGGEQEFPLPPLPTPPEGPETPERLIAYPSVALFVHRAQAARPDFQLRPQNTESVAALCAKLEGVPLAIELAAAWAQTLTPGQMLERLQHRFDLLVSRRRDLPGRHATLRATIEWSYRLLPPDLRQFFTRLSVFRGGWTLEAAEAITGERNALLYLTELRERSLVLAAEEPADTAAATRKVNGPAPASKPGCASRCWKRCASSRWNRPETLEQQTALASRHLDTSCAWPKRPSRSCAGPRRRPTCAASSATTTTCGRRWHGAWSTTPGIGGCAWRPPSPGSGSCTATSRRAAGG
jgi:hypothetical protein